MNSFLYFIVDDILPFSVFLKLFIYDFMHSINVCYHCLFILMVLEE